jgi:hypothetical protein
MIEIKTQTQSLIDGINYDIIREKYNSISNETKISMPILIVLSLLCLYALITKLINPVLGVMSLTVSVALIAYFITVNLNATDLVNSKIQQILIPLFNKYTLYCVYFFASLLFISIISRVNAK